MTEFNLAKIGDEESRWRCVVACLLYKLGEQEITQADWWKSQHATIKERQTAKGVSFWVESPWEEVDERG